MKKTRPLTKEEILALNIMLVPVEAHDFFHVGLEPGLRRIRVDHVPVQCVFRAQVSMLVTSPHLEVISTFNGLSVKARKNVRVNNRERTETCATLTRRCRPRYRFF